MIRLVTALAMAVTLHVSTARAIDAPTGPIVLTIIGNVPEANRPPFDPILDGFINYHEYSFERAVAFDTAMLAELPQVEVTANYHEWPGPVTASGPLLSTVLDAAGVDDDQTITLVALDGYAIEFTPAERVAQEYVLAMRAGSVPLGVGDRGPSWLLHDTSVKGATDEEESKWVWSVFLITAD